MFKWLYILAGISLWLPSFAVFTIGEQTGIQLALLFYSIIFILQFVVNRTTLRRDNTLIYVYLMWAICLSLSIFASDNISASVRGIIAYISTLTVFFTIVLSQIDRKIIISSTISGYLSGGILSSLYGIYQYYGFKFSLPYTTLLQNNQAFSSYASNVGDYFSIGTRAFGFTAEPSQFSALLLAAVLIAALNIKESNGNISHLRLLRLVILFVGLLTSGSLSLLTSLPIIFILLLATSSEWRRLLLSFVTDRKKLWITYLAIIVVCIVFINGYIDLTRVQSLQTDKSFLVRAGSIVAAVLIFLNHPLTGYGLNAMGPAYQKYMPDYVFALQEKTGTDSLFLAIAAEQGIFGLIAILSMVIISLIRSKSNLTLYTVVIVLLVTFAIQTPYMYLYHFWVFLALGFISNENGRFVNTMALKKNKLYNKEGHEYA
ncbi:hypothetical protein FHS18_000596 [Paenibacillus phyllosphaerae]|uniref:O-antigen ligase-related domain-containing protein n=1 Tax=Paenibacillus phyllosphaerae TaxID=274593 RepID=A0A7W5FL00_9BACL|nr:O-antigen ligase family protein [Paenibacillus phyllosphaerae]MBB3108568.1 hypothetical protein [Paenibacillus phyllosphaerae]